MPIESEPIGSIPRPRELIEGMAAFEAGRLPSEQLEALYDGAVRETIARFEDAGSPVVTDVE